MKRMINMSKLIVALCLVLSFAVWTTPAQAGQTGVPESNKTILMVMHDWTSQLVNTEIVYLILTSIGYNVDKVPVDDHAKYPAMELGDVTLAMEAWETSNKASYEASIATGKTVDLGETGMKAKEEWWYPIYVKEKCPGLPNWEALKNCAELFSAPETAPKGRYLSGPVNWGGHDEERVKALDLPYEVVHAGTDASMFAELQSAYDRKAPILLWVWAPHWAPQKYEGEWIEFPKYTDDCYNDPKWGVNPNLKYDCGKPTGWVKKIGWAEGEKIWPCAYQIARNFKMDNSTIGRLTAEVDLEGKSVREVALQWLKSNEATWKSWASCSK